MAARKAWQELPPLQSPAMRPHDLPLLPSQLRVEIGEAALALEALGVACFRVTQATSEVSVSTSWRSRGHPAFSSTA